MFEHFPNEDRTGLKSDHFMVDLNLPPLLSPSSLRRAATCPARGPPGSCPVGPGGQLPRGRAECPSGLLEPPRGMPGARARDTRGGGAAAFLCLCGCRSPEPSQRAEAEETPGGGGAVKPSAGFPRSVCREKGLQVPQPSPPGGLHEWGFAPRHAQPGVRRAGRAGCAQSCGPRGPSRSQLAEGIFHWALPRARKAAG